MAKNIVEAVQERLGYAPLEKVDPNLQDAKHAHSSSQKLAQAAIPAVLAALYRHTRTEKGCREVVEATRESRLFSELFEGSSSAAAEKVAAYAGVTHQEAEHQMDKIAWESTGILKEIVGPVNKNGDLTSLKNYMSSQRHNILVYLPAALQMGDILHDEQLDDRTNKMEGPVSNFMHKIEDTLSGGGKK